MRKSVFLVMSGKFTKNEYDQYYAEMKSWKRVSASKGEHLRKMAPASGSQIETYV